LQGYSFARSVVDGAGDGQRLVEIVKGFFETVKLSMDGADVVG
jgi:hypothetical protein